MYVQWEQSVWFGSAQKLNDFMFKSVDTFPRTQNYVNGILVNIDKIANILMDNI